MNLTKKDKELNKKFEEIIKLKEQGNYNDAISKAKKLNIDYKNLGSIHGLLAIVYFEIDEFDEAAKYYKKTTIISPKSKMASLGLFHSLWQLGDKNGAFEEMKRYMNVAKSKEYEELYKNLN